MPKYLKMHGGEPNTARGFSIWTFSNIIALQSTKISIRVRFRYIISHRALLQPLLQEMAELCSIT